MDEDMLDRLTGYVSLRNAIVHDYDLVTASTVRQGAERLAQDVPALIQALLRS